MSSRGKQQSTSDNLRITAGYDEVWAIIDRDIRIDTVILHCLLSAIIGAQDAELRSGPAAAVEHRHTVRNAHQAG